jgi:hypothetical protein
MRWLDSQAVIDEGNASNAYLGVHASGVRAGAQD